MGIYVKLKRVLSYGSLAGRKYSLMCIGNFMGSDEILLNDTCPFYESLNNRSPIHRNPSSIVFSSPLSVQMNIVILVKEQQNMWLQSVLIDLENGHFSIQPYYEDSRLLPPEISALILSSFGIQKKNKAISLAALAQENQQMDSHQMSRPNSVWLDDDPDEESSRV